MKNTILSIASLALTWMPAHHAFADAPTDLGESITKVFERMGDDVDANKPDCDKIGAALMKHADEDASVMKDAKKADQGKTSDQKKAAKAEIEKKYGTRMQAAQKKASPLKACRTNATIKGYMTKVGF